MPYDTARSEALAAVAALEESLARLRAALPEGLADTVLAAAVAGVGNQLAPPSEPSFHPLGLPLAARSSLPPGAAHDSFLARDALQAALGTVQSDAPATATSVRLPADLHAVARDAVAAGWAGSLSELIVAGLRHELGALATNALDEDALAEARTALEQHYADHPEARPPLAMVAQSAAELERHPASQRPDLIELAITDLGPDSYVEDVLAWVKGAIAHESRAGSTRTTDKVETS